MKLLQSRACSAIRRLGSCVSGVQGAASKNMSREKPTKLGLRASGRRARQTSCPTPVLSILNRTCGHPYASMSESSVITCRPHRSWDLVAEQLLCLALY